MFKFYSLPAELVARMDSLAVDTDGELPDHDTTTLMCEPLVTFDGATRRALAYRLPRGSIHDDTVAELLHMVTDGGVSVSRNGKGYFFASKSA